MNITAYFIKHPVSAFILNIMIILLGWLSFDHLALREYPRIVYPKIAVSTNYPNASAELVETTITNLLEDRLAGLEGLERIQSYSTHGNSYIQLSFKNHVSLDQTFIAIQEAIHSVYLPPEAMTPRIQRHTGSDGLPFMAISLESSTMNLGELTHYAMLHLKNIFRSLPGVSSVQIVGQPYQYQITLDTHKLFAFGLNADDVFKALQNSDLSLPVGKFQNEIPATLRSEMKSKSDYENLVIRKIQDSDGKMHVISLKNVADVNLTTNDQEFRVRINGQTGLAIMIDLTTEANPLDVSDSIRAQIEKLKIQLPAGLQIGIVIDQADFIRSSLSNIESSIIEAIVFVLIIVFLFLRRLQAALIPLITIPISLLGSFIFLRCFGFSINTLTLMAMVLAVGLVVDDAIIVLENIQRHLELKKSKLEACVQGAKEISFAIIAMTLTLTSVYLPLTFISGTIGQLFTEFAVALAGSVLISGVVALTLSPLMCRYLLTEQTLSSRSNADHIFKKLEQQYASALSSFMTYKKLALSLIFFTIAIIYIFLHFLPQEMAPSEDRSLVGIYIPPIAGENLDAMEDQLQLIESMIKSIPESKTSLTFMGTWGGNIIFPLEDHSKRTRSAEEILASIRPQVAHFPSLEVYPFTLNSGLPGVDPAKRGQLELVISTTHSYQQLFQDLEKARAKIEEENYFSSVSHDLNLDSTSYSIQLNLNEMAALQISPYQVAKTIEIFFSGDSSLNFSKDGILYPLLIQGDHQPWSLSELYITNSHQKRISLGVIAKHNLITQPESLYHENQMRSARLSVSLKEDEHLALAMSALFKTTSKYLQEDYQKTWVGSAKKYADAQMTTTLLFTLSIIFIFAILSLQFQNFLDPFIILFTVPLACSGALALAWITGQSFNIYTQVGLITLMGIITKHGILMVEFSNQLCVEKFSTHEAIMRASRMRLRPILMTTGAMIFGAIPLLLSHDAGHESRFSIGIILIGGLSTGTLFTLFILPHVYEIAQFLRRSQKRI